MNRNMLFGRFLHSKNATALMRLQSSLLLRENSNAWTIVMQIYQACAYKYYLFAFMFMLYNKYTSDYAFNNVVISALILL